MKILAAAALVLALAAAPPPVHAHGSMAAWYGGQITETAEGLRVEFAVREGGVRAWVRDHDDKPVAATGKAVLLVNGTKSEVTLNAKGDVLTGEASVTPAHKITAILSLNVGGKAISARFGQEAVVQPAALNGPAQAGKQAFEQICATCHGVALRGSDNAPPLLHPFDGPNSGHGDDVILAAAGNGAKSHMWKFGDMPKPQGLKPGQEKEVLAYIRAMQSANGLGGDSAVPMMPMDHGAMDHGAMGHGGHNH